MTREDGGRLIVCCDNCPVRMDLGPAQLVRQRNRTPSGWIATGFNRHYCPTCSPRHAMARFGSPARPQPLVTA